MHSSVHYREPKGKGHTLFLCQTEADSGKGEMWSRGRRSFAAFQLPNTSGPVLQSRTLSIIFSLLSNVVSKFVLYSGIGS
jgi:hypothetical protein